MRRSLAQGSRRARAGPARDHTRGWTSFRTISWRDAFTRRRCIVEQVRIGCLDNVYVEKSGVYQDRMTVCVLV
jgi:hypothetical protein